jgi:uracil-DNA glycosylase
MSFSANDLNIQLRNLYFDRLPDLYKTIITYASDEQLGDMHGPFLMDVQPEYLNARKKIMFVGMETHGWRKCDLNEDLPVSYEKLIQCHQEFMAQEKPINSPFWWFMRDLNAVYQESDLRKTVLWTNLSKIDVGKNRPVGDLYDNTMAGFIDLLLAEVDILKPEIVVIMTSSPNYQWHLNQNLGLTSGEALREELIPKLLYKWTSQKLPENTFQICHPNSLRFRKGGFKQNAETIIRNISEHTL